MNPEEIISAGFKQSWNTDSDNNGQSSETNDLGKTAQDQTSNKNSRGEKSKNLVRVRRPPARQTYEKILPTSETQEITLEFSDFDEEFDDDKENNSGNQVNFNTKKGSSCIQTQVITYTPVETNDANLMYSKVNKKQKKNKQQITYADIETATLKRDRGEKKQKNQKLRKSKSTEELDTRDLKKSDRNSKILLALAKPFHSLRAIKPKSPRLSVARYLEIFVN